MSFILNVLEIVISCWAVYTVSVFVALLPSQTPCDLILFDEVTGDPPFAVFVEHGCDRLGC
jgi:hypothetical protein